MAFKIPTTLKLVLGLLTDLLNIGRKAGLYFEKPGVPKAGTRATKPGTRE